MAVERLKDPSKEERRKGVISCQEKSKSHPHPLPARLDEAGQPVRSAVQEPLYAGAAQHRGHARGDHQRQDEEGADLEAHRYGCGRAEG